MGKIPTTSVSLLTSRFNRSINRPSRSGQGVRLGSAWLEPIEVTFQSFGDAVVSLSLTGPYAAVGVGLQDVDVVELISQCGSEFGCWCVAVAGFADVRVGARALALMPLAVAVGDAGFEHFRGEPGDLVRNDRTPNRGQRQLATHGAHGLVIGAAQRR